MTEPHFEMQPFGNKMLPENPQVGITRKFTELPNESTTNSLESAEKEPWKMTKSEFVGAKYPILHAVRHGEKVYVGEHGEVHSSISLRNMEIRDDWGEKEWDEFNKKGSIETGWVDRSGNWLTKEEASQLVAKIENKPSERIFGESRYVGQNLVLKHKKSIDEALTTGKLTIEQAENLGHFKSYPELKEKFMIKGFHFGEKVKIKAPWGTKYGTMYSMNEQGIYYVQIDGEPMVGVVKEYLSSVDPNPKFQRHS